MTQPLPLPMKFPCWVRAVYSWGGETKKDLGFIEGDLIECLNAGDGSWWMGRLRRDRRMVGLFPSNFVQVLDDSYQTGGSQAVSPIPQRRPSANPPPATPAKVETPKAYRKPFQSYHKGGSPNPLAAQRDAVSRNTSTVRPGSAASARKPFASMKRESAGSLGGSRSPSPMPSVQQMTSLSQRPTSIQPISRQNSPGPQWQPRTASPLPPSDTAHSRGPSRSNSAYENQHQDYASPPPPAPPPHRYATSRAGTPQPPAQTVMHAPRTPEQETTTHKQGFTPSPLTNAMNDVMQCLEDIHLMKQDESYMSPSQYNGQDYNDYEQGCSGDEQYRIAPLSRTGSMTTFQPQVTGSLDFSMILPPMEDRPPEVPLKTKYAPSRPVSSLAHRQNSNGSNAPAQRALAHRKSAYELGRTALNRTLTTKTTATESSNITNHTVASIASAGAFSATSAGSFYRHKDGHGSYSQRPKSAMDRIDRHPLQEAFRPDSPMTGISYHTSHASEPSASVASNPRDWEACIDTPSITGGLTASPGPSRNRKSGFFKRMVDTAKTSAATARSTISAATTSSGTSRPNTSSGLRKSKSKSDLFGQSFENIPTSPLGKQYTTGGNSFGERLRPQSSYGRIDVSDDGISWVQVRRDINRANSLSRNEREDRIERCQLLDIPVIAPISEILQTLEGDEGIDGLPVTNPQDLAENSCNYSLVDKNARFADNLPKFIGVQSLVQGYLCRPYRSDLQRLRSIFIWVAEKIIVDEDYGHDSQEQIDTRQVLSSRRGSPQEVATLVTEMCAAVGICAEVVEGYLKVPGEQPCGLETSTSRHFWNAVVVEGEWRMMDCAIASPCNSRRGAFTASTSQVAEGFYFLTPPSQICYTHIPADFSQQHMIPPQPLETLMALPAVCPTYFRNDISLVNFDSSQLHLENLDVAQVWIRTPEDIEIVAHVEAHGLSRDGDGDRFENGEVLRKTALCQAQWVHGCKRWTVKAVLPGDVGQGILKIFAGRKGLMHSIKSNPHSLALTLPLWHTGQSPAYDFLLRHPTTHAQRHDLYIVTPQCDKLASNNTYVFTVRQHASSLHNNPSTTSSHPTLNHRSSLGALIPRPSSAMSTLSASISGSTYSSSASGSNSSSQPSSSSSSHDPSSLTVNKKPAKLAIQSPSGRIIRLTRKMEGTASSGRQAERHDGSDWETVIKIGERGAWRALVLADRSARWCVFAEWECP